MTLRNVLGTLIFLTLVLAWGVTKNCGQKNSPQPESQVRARGDAKKVKVVAEPVKAEKPLEAAMGAEEGSVLQRLGYEKKLKEVLDKVQFVVSVKVGKSFVCTGFFIDERGYILTARHCMSDLNSGLRLSFVFTDGKEHPMRFVEEIQTLDMILFASDKAVEFQVAELANPPEATGLDKSRKEKEDNLEKKMVVIPCRVKNDGSARAIRTYLGELLSKESDKRVSLLQLQQDMAGCSGAPIIDVEGKVIAILHSRSGEYVYGIPVAGLREAVAAVISEDLSRTGKK
ncbi:MAG: trypsin-like peptidase domain-containing protein [Candidatus Yanofskybacteria bacterium]|nr:trypsin-like peptidase domain-containing protein [Candidatus Yanofskybacteria bacterium]